VILAGLSGTSALAAAARICRSAPVRTQREKTKSTLILGSMFELTIDARVFHLAVEFNAGSDVECRLGSRSRRRSGRDRSTGRRSPQTRALQPCCKRTKPFGAACHKRASIRAMPLCSAGSLSLPGGRATRLRPVPAVRLDDQSAPLKPIRRRWSERDIREFLCDQDILAWAVSPSCA
jgi:hypothetical protein